MAEEQIQSLDSRGYSDELEHHEERVQASGQERQEVREKTKDLADAMDEHDGHTVSGDRHNAIEQAEDFLAAMMYVSMALTIIGACLIHFHSFFYAFLFFPPPCR